MKSIVINLKFTLFRKIYNSSNNKNTFKKEPRKSIDFSLNSVLKIKLQFFFNSSEIFSTNIDFNNPANSNNKLSSFDYIF